MTRRAHITAASLVLAHVPDLVRYGSKPSREPGRSAQLCGALRGFDEATRYPPNQAFIGNLAPEELWELPRPWWGDAARASSPTGHFGEILDQATFYDLLAEMDQFNLVRLKEEPHALGDLPLYGGDRVVGTMGAAHERDEALSAQVLLENLACKASGAHALRFLLRSNGIDPASIDYAIGCGEEAVGDRYQRGGGSLGKAIAEACGLVNATGADVKAFCAAPIHALVAAGALVESGVCDRVAVVAGGSLAKLGMKFLGALDHGVPILEDVLAGMAILLGPASNDAPVMRMDAVGLHRIGSGSSQQALLEDVVARPLEKLGVGLLDVDRYATELHNPEISEPAGGGDVPARNYRMLAGLAVVRGELARKEIEGFARDRGMPGFSPTQGHVASAIPWLPHALERFRAGELHRTMLIARGSLFLGRMTQMWDGISVTLEA